MSDVIWADNEGIVHIRNSERGTLANCPQQWWWGWRDGLRAKETAKPLWFGTAIHEALAHYYGPGRKRRTDWVDKFRESADMEAEYIRTSVGGLDEEEWITAKLLGEQMLWGYAKQYNGDPDWDVIGTEQSFELRVPFFSKGDARDAEAYREWIRNGMSWDLSWDLDYFILNGTFDGVYRDRSTKRIKLMEHKTAASISISHLPMDNQAGTYWLVAQTVGRAQGWLGPKERISEITYNYLRKALPDPRPRDAQGYCTNKPSKEAYVTALEADGVEWPLNKAGKPVIPVVQVLEEIAGERGLVVIGERSKSQPPALYERHAVKKTTAQRKTQLMRLQDEVQMMASYVSGQMNITKSPSRNTCGMCGYKEMCELHESGADWVEFRDALYRRTDPYADHRKSASA